VPVIETFNNRTAQLALAGFSILIAVIGLAMLTDASARVSGIIFFVLGACFTVRAMRSSSVILRDDEVETRSILRTRRYALSELEGVDVAVGRTGLNGFGREHLVLHRQDGTRVVFKDMNAKPSTAHDTNVRRAAKAITDSLRAR
jgi:hypothetical protein